MTKSLLLLCLSPFLLALSFRAVAQKTREAGPLNIYITKMGNGSQQDINLVKNALIDFYKANIILLPETKVLNHCEVKGMNRYNADKILMYLNTTHKHLKGKVLMITDKEICTDRKLNGKVYKNYRIFGYGSVNGQGCVISPARMKHIDKLKITAIHEIGHTLGLHHCPNEKCIMADLKGKGANIYKTKEWLCDRCRAQLK